MGKRFPRYKEWCPKCGRWLAKKLPDCPACGWSKDGLPLYGHWVAALNARMSPLSNLNEDGDRKLDTW